MITINSEIYCSYHDSIRLITNLLLVVFDIIRYTANSISYLYTL